MIAKRLSGDTRAAALFSVHSAVALFSGRVLVVPPRAARRHLYQDKHAPHRHLPTLSRTFPAISVCGEHEKKDARKRLKIESSIKYRNYKISVQAFLNR